MKKLSKYEKVQYQLEHLFLGGCYYGYLWADHMVHLWNQKMKDVSLAEQGTIMKKLLVNSSKRAFTDEFSKVIMNPYDGEFNIDKTWLKSYFE